MEVIKQYLSLDLKEVAMNLWILTNTNRHFLLSYREKPRQERQRGNSSTTRINNKILIMNKPMSKPHDHFRNVTILGFLFNLILCIFSVLSFKGTICIYLLFYLYTFSVVLLSSSFICSITLEHTNEYFNAM